MITGPLDLQSKRAAPPKDFDALFWVNVGVVCLFFSLLGSKFVLAPGLQVSVGSGVELPRSNSGVPSAAEVVVSYRRDNMILFEGGIYELAGLRGELARYAKENPGAQMIVRLDRQVSVQGLVDLCDLAREVGFAGVLIPTLSGSASEGAFVTKEL